MKNVFKKIKFKISFFFHSFFQGLRSADAAMLSQVSGEDSDDQEVSHKLEINSVYADLLRERKTQEVEETIDMSYRIAREADKYEVTLVGDLGDDSVGSDKELSAIAVKKVAMKYDKHPEVFNEKGYHVTLIQDNKKIQKKSVWTAGLGDFVAAINSNGDDFITTLDLTYDGFTPRFQLEKFISKIVMRETKGGKMRVDFYVASEAGQFTKTDAILIAELHRIMDNDLKKTDFLDIQTASFVTDKAYGAEDYVRYTLSQLNYKKATIFDGYFVLVFDVNSLQINDIVEEHMTESLTKKYDEMAPKGDGIALENIGAIERRNEKLAKKKAQKQ